ncbi:MAG: tail fiber domain-containing protein [Candidatus Sulfotelmatobacter sp.]
MNGLGYFGSNVDSVGDVIVDYNDQNIGSYAPGLYLGFDGSIITSTQSSGANLGGMDFWTGYTDQMSITSNGYFGIGTRSPYTKLHLVQSNSGGLGPSITLMNNGGGAGSGASVDFDGYDPQSNAPTVRIQSIDDGISSSSLTFQTKTPGAATNGLVEQVRISDYGSLIVDSSSSNTGSIGAGATAGTGLVFGGPGSGEGIASSRSTLYNQYGLDFYTGWTSRLSIQNNGYVTVGYGMTVVNGSGTALLVGGDADVTGCLIVSGSTIAGTCSSDSALKTNIQPFPSVLDKPAQLQPVHFNWKHTNPSGYPSDPARQTGLIAQQVEKVFPEMVSIDKEGYRRVNYSQLPYLLLEGVRELKTSNDSLRAETERQREQNEQARAEIAKLRRAAAATDARVARLARSSAAKNAQIVVLSHEIEQLRKAQEQMAVLLARFAPPQGERGKPQTAQARPAVKAPAAPVSEIAHAQF